MRRKLRKAVKEALKKLGVVKPSHILIAHTKNLKNGDYYTNIAHKIPNIDANELAEKVVQELRRFGVKGVTDISPAAGFINFYLSPSELANSIKKANKEGVRDKKNKWGANTKLRSKKIMVEYTDPNPFKEFHIGHLMSNAIGESIARLLQFSDADVKRANYQGDVGPHVAKAIWAWREKGFNIGDTYIGLIASTYAEGAKQYEENPEARKEIDEVNKKIYEKTDPVINSIYDTGLAISLEHFAQIYKILDTTFDYSFFESVTAPKGLEIVKAHPEVFTESDGARIFRGEEYGLHTRVFITSKGLPTYETKELGLAVLKNETWPSDVSITVTAHEQSDYFKVVLAAMKEVMPEIALKIRHVSHGMMRFAEGKMSSRTGNVVTGESLLNDLTDAAKVRAAESRAGDADVLAQQIAVAAIKYQILKQASGKDIIFDRERALSLEGDSGPYLQYAHARAQQLIEKARNQGLSNFFFEERVKEVTALTRLIHRFPEIVEYATNLREPHILTNYLIELAGEFNSWYAQVPILKFEADASLTLHRLAITNAFRSTLKNGLWLLGIPAPEKM